MQWKMKVSVVEYDPDLDPERYEPPEEELPRDNAVDEAKVALRAFFDQDPTRVFYKQQLEVIFEGTYFHWVTSRAISEVAAEGRLAADPEVLEGVGHIIFYHLPSHRYWR